MVRSWFVTSWSRVLAVGVFAGALAACSAPTTDDTASGDLLVGNSTAPPPTLSTATRTSPSPAESQPAPVRTSLPRENYAVTFSSTDGYKQTATITLGPLVLGNDSDLMESEWASVGGRGAIPCLDALVNGYAVVQTTLAGYAFGTMTITNDVPSFAPSAVSYYFDTNGLDAPFLVMGVGYSSGSTCSDGDLTASPSFSITPDWGDGTRATWGPVPIVIVMANVRAPAYPNGDAGKVASAEPLRVSTVGGSNAVDIPLSLYTP